jgi:curved DNA-binding protein CbpA
MPDAFQYKPKFLDIRVRPPKPEEEAAAQDVNALKPGERACDNPGCRLAATARAPKSRELPGEHYWFCLPHAAEYNRNWNFFAGMSEGEIRRRQEDELFTGGRPTWDFKASANSRENGAFYARTGRGRAGFRDPFNMFGHNAGKAVSEPAGRNLGKIERHALADLDLDEAAEPPAIRARYTELVKRCHPDANGGDRSAEDKLQRVIRAYQALRKAGMA